MVKFYRGRYDDLHPTNEAKKSQLIIKGKKKKNQIKLQLRFFFLKPILDHINK